MRPILRRQQIDVLNGNPDDGIPTRIELQLCGSSDSEVPLKDEPIVCVYSAVDDPYLGEELRLPLAALQEFIDSSADPAESAAVQLLSELRSKADRLKPYSPIWVRVDDLLERTSLPSTHTSDGSPESTESAAESGR